MLDSASKIWFAGDTGQFIERGHVLSALYKFEVMLIIDHLKLPITIEDINGAKGSAQIAEWLSVTPNIALKIVECRERGGRFFSREELIERVKALQTSAIKGKIDELLVNSEEDRQSYLKSVARFTNGLLCWQDLRKISQPPDVLNSRMEFVWDAVSMIRRKLLLYLKTKTYRSMHHKTGLLSFYLRSMNSKKRSLSQKQCAFACVLQIVKVSERASERSELVITCHD